MPDTICATVTQTQKRSPGSRLAIHANSPQTQPTVNSATTKNPTNLWTSTTRRSLRASGGQKGADPIVGCGLSVATSMVEA
jgi:hypothetical protein